MTECIRKGDVKHCKFRRDFTECIRYGDVKQYSNQKASHNLIFIFKNVFDIHDLIGNGIFWNNTLRSI